MLTEEDALIEQQLRETVLPPDIEEWFERVAGCVKTTMPFDSLVDLTDYYQYGYEEVERDD